MLNIEGGQTHMDKHPAVLYKTLVVGVMILFIGMGIQPAIAVDVSASISDDEDDCDICPSIEEIVNNKDVEKYQEILDKITTIQERNMEINPDKPWEPKMVICTVLLLSLAPLILSFMLIDKIFQEYDGSILANLLVLLSIIPTIILGALWQIDFSLIYLICS